MGTVKGTKAKLLVALIIFMIVFSNCGFTLSAIATSGEFQVITNGFFRKDEIDFKAYFEDEKGNQTTEITGNVNQKVRLILDILPQVDGYLKLANLKAVSENDSEVNFKITGVSYYEKESSLEAKPSVDLNVNEKDEENQENTKEAENVVENPSLGNTVIENTVVENVVENSIAENIISNTTVLNEVASGAQTEEDDELSGSAMVSTNSVSEISNTTNENVANEVSNSAVNEVSNTVANEVSNVVTNTVENKVEEAVNEPESTEPTSETSNEIVNIEDILIDEDKVIEEKFNEEKTEQSIIEQNLLFDMKVVSDTEIELRNVTKETKFVLELEYEMVENLKVEDLMKDVYLQLSGTYINSDLEEVPVAKEEKVTLGWEYTKDVALTSEFTKFSPFEVGDIKGTIIENKISVEREITDDKYLPIKNTKLEVGVPKVNGKNPTEINVIGEKLLATRGEDTGFTNFGKDNWTYDAGTGKIEISVENTNLVYSSGLDEYVIIYRYEDMIDAENSDLGKDVKLTVEEFSDKNNHIITKEINEMQNIKVDVGELITYSISSTEEKINKAKIYANYNNETPVYETVYTNQVNVNILTSDILEELKINCDKEVYKDVSGLEFEAQGIEYRKIRFSYYEISNLLVNGGDIVIENTAGEVLYVLNKDIIHSEEDCTINLNGQSGIIIYARNIAKNGNLNFELVKVIKGCNYEKSAFKNFTSIESRITAEVKYEKIEERLALPTIGTAKAFEESKTLARLSLNKETLSTTKSNENVEIKVELNNDKEDSDLYINPAFEIVFPKYVDDVTIQNLNVLYENGLRVDKVDTYKENDIVKIRVELEGMQKTFSESTITNGTNIIINANIKVDEYTPKKEDQIKLYYCNEGVSTYESQTKWSISKQIPSGILKTTNGFDVAIIKYQAPSGLIAINGIVNYDGNLSELKSVKQGEVKAQIGTNESSKIMTMELLALNNTDNKCSDVVLLGRIPFAGVKDVITNEDLKTTTTTVIKDLLKEDTLNTNTVDIYYSTNPNASKELDNIGNGWTKEVTNINEIKSFLIVVKGAMEPGQVLRYTYDFEVPANLPYETNIEGSFGAFYNNNSDIAVVYESSIADPVGLVTAVGPKITAELSVDIGDGTEILSNKRMSYTVKVTNEGSEVANDVVVKAKIPQYAVYVEKNVRTQIGDFGYETRSVGEVDLNIGTLNAGESKEVSYLVKTDNIPTLSSYASGSDENGYYMITGYTEETVEREETVYIEDAYFDAEGNPKVNYDVDGNVIEPEPEYDEEGNIIERKPKTEIRKWTEIAREPIKEYITEVPDIYIENKATVTTSLLANPIETNIVRNKLKQSDFASEIKLDFNRELMTDMKSNFALILTNTSGKDMQNVIAVMNIGDIYTYQSGKIDGEDGDIRVSSEEGKIYFTLGNMASGDSRVLEVWLVSKQVEEYTKTVDCYFEYSADGVEADRSTIIPQTVSRSFLEAKDMSINVPEKIKENESMTISTLITNISTMDCNTGILEIDVPSEMKVSSIMSSDGNRLSSSSEDGNKTYITLPVINGKQSKSVDITLTALNMPGSQSSNVSIKRIVHNDGQDDITINPIELEIENTEKTFEEKENERIEDLKKQEEQNKNNNSNNNSNGNNSNGNSSNGNNSNGDSSNGNSNNGNSNNGNNSNGNSNNGNGNNGSNGNGSSNNSNNKNNNGNNAITTNNKAQTYLINGLAWLDVNKDGIRDDSESGIGGVKVYLLNSNSNMLKSTITSDDGHYQFSELPNGRYVVAVAYDQTQYSATTYRNTSAGEDRYSSIIENEDEDLTGITNEINVSNANVENINIGLQNKETFDLKVNKYISKISVENGKYSNEYELDNLELAKVEIPSKRINGAKVTLEYTINIENVGEIAGYAEELVDYIEDDVIFDQNLNSDWYVASDGYVYAKNLEQTLLQKGDKKEIKLVLIKNMNEENTGTLSNKIALLKTFSQSNAKENTENNTNTQNTLILISTGHTLEIVLMIIIVLMLSFIVYGYKDKLYSNISKIRKIKKIYK